MAFSFGAPPAPAATTTAAPSSTPFSFGQPTQQQNQNQQQSQPPAAASSGFSFGNQSQNQPQSQPQGASQPTNSFGGGFNFGSKPAATASFNSANTFSFSNPSNANSNNAASSTSGFSFGQSQNQSQSQNQNQNQSQAQPQQQQQNGFNPNNALSSSLNNTQSNQNKRLGLSLSTEIDRIRSAWDTNNIQTCRFLCYFYNSVPTQQIRALSDGLGPQASNQNIQNGGMSGINGEKMAINYNTGRRLDAVGQRHENLWSQAVRECPDRENLLPVLALGFPDLQKRITAQTTESNRQLQHLQSLTNKLSALTQRHDLSNIVRIKSSANKQKELHQRLIALVRRSSKLVGGLRNKGIDQEEEDLRNRLESLDGELNGVGGSAGSGVRSINFNGTGTVGRRAFGNSLGNARVNGFDDESNTYSERLNPRINDLWANLSTAKIHRSESRDAGQDSQYQQHLEWAMVDEEKINEVVRILGSQQHGLTHLLKTLDSDNNSIDVVVKGLEEVGMIGR